MSPRRVDEAAASKKAPPDPPLLYCTLRILKLFRLRRNEKAQTNARALRVLLLLMEKTKIRFLLPVQ